MKKSIVSLSLFAALMLSSTAIAQTPPPKPTTPDAVVAAFKAAGLEAESPVPLARTDYGKAPFVCKGVRFEMPSLSEDSAGRAFYCARKADRDRLARYYTSLGQQNPELFWHVFVSPPYVVQLSGDLADEQAAKYEAALMQIGSSTVVTVAKSEPLIKVTFDRAGYDYWGRPKYMIDKTATDCGSEDEKHQVMRLEISLAITNNSPTQTMTVDSWKGQFYKADGSEAATCHWLYADKRDRPDIQPGQTVPVTYMAFVEKGERVGYGYISDAVLGQSNRIEVPTTLPLP